MTGARVGSGQTTLGSLYWALRKILKLALIVLLIGLLVGAGAMAVWAGGPVQTGAGQLTRFEAARVYLYLMGQQEPWPCQWTYAIFPLTALVTIPATTLQEAVGGEIAFAEVPGVVGQKLQDAMQQVFHTHAGRCRIKPPAEWTPSLLKDIFGA